MNALPFSERMLIAIDRLVQARIKEHAEINRTPHQYAMHVEASKREVKAAQYGLRMMLDDLSQREPA